MDAVYWQAPGPEPWASPVPPRSADVVVVGAGLTGLSAALSAARCGRHVVVVDAGAVGDGASGRNGGQVLTGFGPDYCQVQRRFGPEQARTLWEQGCRAVEHVAGLIAREGIACGWHRGGHLAVAPSAAFRNRLAQQAAALQSAGFAVQWLTADEVAARLGWPGYRGGLFDPASATCNPYQLTRGLARAAARAGVSIVEGAAAQVVPARGSYLVSSAKGSITCQQVLLAVNARLPAHVPALRHRLHPARGWVLATAPLPEPLASELLPGRPAVFEESDRYAYFQLTGDRRLVLGGRVSPGAAPDRARADLQRLLAAVAPPLTGIDIDFVWTGPLAIAADGWPRWGRTPAGVHWLGGYTGHGVALAVWLGGEMGRFLATGEPPSWPLGGLPPRALPRGARERTFPRPGPSSRVFRRASR